MCYREGWNIDKNPRSTKKWLIVALVVFVLGLILSIFCKPCHAQMKEPTITPGVDPELVIQPREIAPLPVLQAQKTMLQKTADTLAARIREIDTAPLKVVADRIAELDKHIAACPDRKVPDGLISMNQFLLQQKYAIIDNPTKYLEDERTRAYTTQTRINATLATVNDDIAVKEGVK